MYNKLLDYFHQSDLFKFFVVGFVIAISMSFIGHFSIYSWIAISIISIALIFKLPFFEDKFNYDQKQQINFNALVFSGLFWSIFLWRELQDFAHLYALTFTILVVTAMLLFDNIKHLLGFCLSLILTFIMLITYFSNQAQIYVAVISLAFISLLYYLNLNSTDIKKIEEKENKVINTTAKLNLVSEVDAIQSENKKLKAQIKKIEIDLSAAEMAKMEFLATMSHEIRTPLNGIIPLLDILLDSELSDFQKDYLSTAHVSAIQMQKLIDDLLDFSRVEAGKLTVESRGLKVPRILEAVHSSFKQAAEKKNLKIEVNINSNVSPLLRGDPTRLRQVLSNLLSNAIKFSTIGTIKMTAKKIKDFPNKEVIRFEVIDQGIGLDKETCENIFLAFTQEDASSTRKFGGTGLGLAISKKIVELMQGSINVESAKGSGSNFYFDLPLLKSVGETSTGITEASNYQAILVNTNPLLFNKISQKLKVEEVPFQKALGMEQAFEIFASINRVSNYTKNVLVFIDFETAGKQVRSLCNDIVNDENLSNLYACVLTENTNIAGIPHHNNIKMLRKDDSIPELLNKIEVLQATLEATQVSIESSVEQSTNKIDDEVAKTLLPEILLVEDNEINLKVAEKLIQYIGYPFDIALNGQEALEKVKLNRYRMILMDCQMPIMDGYRSTAKIREFELASGLNRTPIMAMTANAMMGDREKCLNAGMDDYMSKPLNRYILEKTLKKWDPLVNVNISSDNAPVKNTLIDPDASIVDKETSSKTDETKVKNVGTTPDEINPKWLNIKTLSELNEIMGDEMLQLLDMFEKETPLILSKIGKALETKNYEEVKKMAHMLKSTSANIGANGLSFFSRKLELAASNKDHQQLANIYLKTRKSNQLTSIEINKYKVKNN